MITPHVRRGHYRHLGKKAIWIRATIIHKDNFLIYFHLLKKEQQDKYYETFLCENTFGATVANTIYTTTFQRICNAN